MLQVNRDRSLGERGRSREEATKSAILFHPARVRGEGLRQRDPYIKSYQLQQPVTYNGVQTERNVRRDQE